MAYSTQAQVETAVGGPVRLAELSDLDNSGVADAGVIAEAIAEADGEIDSYLGQRFFVPLATVPAVIASKSAAWAARVLRRNRANGRPLDDDIAREEIDIKWLLKVADGTISIGIEPGPPKASKVIDKVGLRDSAASVGRERLKGFW